MASTAFNNIATGYDDYFTQSAIGQLQRKQVYRILDKHLYQPRKILELNCGTGVDAHWLANKGHQVLATDISEKMIQVAIQKSANPDNPTFGVCAAEEIDKYQGQTFDLLFSNFGGLNCLDAQALHQSAAAFSKLLSPKGKFIAVIMGDKCRWENLYFLLKLNPQKAFRRSTSKALEVNIGNGTTIKTWYYSPSQFAKFYNRYFSIDSIHPIGLTVPPSYLEPAFKNRKNWLNILYKIEKQWQDSATAARYADHFLIVLDKK